MQTRTLSGKLQDEAKKRDTVFYPIICYHPVMQRPAIYAYALQTAQVIDVSDAKGGDILESLSEAIHLAGTTDGNWEQNWRVAAIMICEYRGGVFHADRMDYPPNKRRIMIRCAIGGGPIEMYGAA